MLKTRENHSIVLHPYENYHKLIVGKSGCGKTWCATREAEISAALMPVLIMDISGSYTDSELKRNKFNNKIRIAERNPKLQTTPLVIHSDLISNVTDALIVTFDVKSMMQRRLLEEACTELIRENRCITFHKLYEKLEKLGDEADDTDFRKNIDFLLSRMFHLRNLSTLQIVSGNATYTKGIYIWQLSDFSDLIARRLAEFILEIEWKNIQSGSKERIQLILDEFQKLRLEHTAIEEMLREGRKYGLGLTMSSQFIPPGRGTADALEQASICLYFQPNDRQLISTAKRIGGQNYKAWIPILKCLDRGSCVLTGHYSLNHNSDINNKPIICKVDG